MPFPRTRAKDNISKLEFELGWQIPLMSLNKMTENRQRISGKVQTQSFQIIFSRQIEHCCSSLRRWINEWKRLDFLFCLLTSESSKLSLWTLLSPTYGYFERLAEGLRSADSRNRMFQLSCKLHDNLPKKLPAILKSFKSGTARKMKSRWNRNVFGKK